MTITFWIKALQLILCLSILVIVHEFGHYFFARLFKVRVEKFYMFFNPTRSLIRAKYFNGRWHVAFLAENLAPLDKDEDISTLPDDDWRKYPDHTEWGIGWIPFGGYCAIVGMVDETQDASKLSATPQPWEFRSKKAWQRFCIIIGGVLVNFLTALIIFCLITFHWGTTTLPLKNASQGLYYSDLLVQQGFEQRDKILTIDGVCPETLGDVVQALVIDGKRDVRVLRGEDTVTLTMSEKLGNDYLAQQNAFDKVEREKARNDDQYMKRGYTFVAEYFPFIADSIMPGSAGATAGLQRGDEILAVNNTPTGSYYEVAASLQQYPCEEVTLTVRRGGDTLSDLKTFLGDYCLLGVFVKSKYDFCPIEQKTYSFFQAIPVGIKQGVNLLLSYVKQFRLVFSKEGAQSLGGFGAIGSMFSDLWDWHAFWYMTAFLSIALAFMNIIPIPALDGGYMLFILVEMLTGRKPSDKFIEKANSVGFIFLILLLIVANLNDILKLFI